MFKSIFLSVFFLFAVLHVSAQLHRGYNVYLSPDKTYRVALPSSWKANPKLDKSRVFDIVDPKTQEEYISAGIYLEIEDADAGADIRSMVSKARASQVLNKKIDIIDSSFVKFNNKEWFQEQYTIALTKKFVTKVQQFETVHNGKYYVFTYSNWLKNFENDKDYIYECLLSFMFFTEDMTNYSIPNSSFSAKEINDALNSIKGVYRYNKTSLGKSYSMISIDNPGNSNLFTAKATEALISEEISCDEKLEANLKVIDIDKDGYVTLSMDKVLNLKEDGNYLLVKQIYKVKPENQLLTVETKYYIGNKDKSVGYFSTFDKIGGTTISSKKTELPKTISESTLSPATNSNEKTGIGTITGKLLNQDDLPANSFVAAQNIETGQIIKTNKTDLNLATGNYSLKLPTGKYYVYSEIPDGFSKRSYYTEFEKTKYKSHKKIVVVINSNKILNNINPVDDAPSEDVSQDKTLPVVSSTTLQNNTNRKKVTTKPFNVVASSILTGSILKRWQVACSLSDKFEFVSTENKLIEFEFLSGEKFNSYEKGIIQASGNYTLATDRKSLLLSGDAVQIPTQIFKLTNDEMIFKMKNNKVFLLYPMNTVKAKAAINKREAYLKLSGSLYYYNDAAVSLTGYLQQLITNFEKSTILPSTDTEIMKNDCKAFEDVRYKILHDYQIVNDYLNIVSDLRRDFQVLNSVIDAHPSLKEDINIKSQLEQANIYDKSVATKEDQLVEQFNQYFKF